MRLKQRGVLLSLAAAVFWAAISAASFYVMVDLIQYQLHTTPCQRMGTCLVTKGH